MKKTLCILLAFLLLSTYQLTEVTMKNPQAAAWQDVVTMIPAEEYVKAEWEIFE